MALSEASSRDEVIASIQAIPGVKSFEWDEKNWFRCVTINTWTDYHSLVVKIEEAGLNVGDIFIHDPERKDGQYFQYESDSNLKNWVTYPEDHKTMLPQSWHFVRMEENVVQEFRFAWRLTEALANDKVRAVLDMSKYDDKTPISPQDKVRFLDWLNRTMRAKWLAKHPEDQHLWDNKDSYLNPVV